MGQDNTNRNLQKAVLQNKDFRDADFSGSDLRGADLTGSDLTGANLTNVKTGITPVYLAVIFIGAFVVSLLSGWVAAKASLAVHGMITDPNKSLRISGFITIAIILFALAYAYRKGGEKTIARVVIPVIIVLLLIALGIRLSGAGTGKVALYPILAVILMVIMVYIGTISRAAAGSLSNILFVVVAIAGGMFGKSIAGGIGPVILAVACALLSKRALQNDKHFVQLRKVIFSITERFGTSFRNANLANTDFSGAKLHNADFSGANLSSVNWGDSKKVNCKINDEIVTDKKKKKHG